MFKYNTIIFLEMCCCPITVQLPSTAMFHCRPTAVQLPFNCRRTAVQLLSNCCPTAVQMPSNCCPTAVQLLSNCRPTAAQLPPNCRPTATPSNCLSTAIQLLSNCHILCILVLCLIWVLNVFASLRSTMLRYVCIIL
jgi:hypothetical protein